MRNVVSKSLIPARDANSMETRNLSETSVRRRVSSAVSHAHRAPSRARDTSGDRLESVRHRGRHEREPSEEDSSDIGRLRPAGYDV